MNLLKRIDLLIRLGQYILSDNERWLEAKQNAERANSWFIAEFIEKATHNIARQFLNAEKLQAFTERYLLLNHNKRYKTVGLVMAGNVPLVGFHDWMCTFLSGHNVSLKTSLKDEVLIKHLIGQLYEWDNSIKNQVVFAELLKGCDAYIATGTNNTARYFDYYFGKYPHIIRRNRSSVAILTGSETKAHMEGLSDDIHLYFGLGCRNATKIFVPEGYDFKPLLSAFNKYDYFIDHNKYKNNYDYQLAIHLINQKYYMTNGSLLLSENQAVFSPISQVNYEYYMNKETLKNNLNQNCNDIQCIIGNDFVPFGRAQSPSVTDYSDGVDTMEFLKRLK